MFFVDLNLGLRLRPCEHANQEGASGGLFLWVPSDAACGATWLGLKALHFPGALLAKEHGMGFLNHCVITGHLPRQTKPASTAFPISADGSSIPPGAQTENPESSSNSLCIHVYYSSFPASEDACNTFLLSAAPTQLQASTASHVGSCTAS